MIEVLNVNKTYLQGRQEILALNNVSFRMEKGEFLSIMGPSGSGKSTLLNLIGGLDPLSAGKKSGLFFSFSIYCRFLMQ